MLFSRFFASAILLVAVSHAETPANKRAPTSPPTNPFAQAIEDTSKVTSVGPGSTGPRVVRAQILLDRARFSPGEIDGVFGEDMQTAIRVFQRTHSLEPSGVVDAATWKLLNRDMGRLLIPYTVTLADSKYPYQKMPTETAEKAKLKALSFETPEEAFGERFHSSPKLILELNPRKKLELAGEHLLVPSIRRIAVAGVAQRVVVSKTNRTVIAYGAQDRILAQYPATIGSIHDPLPLGKWAVTNVVLNPWFNYDPELFWNPDPKNAKAVLPPGPNNPSGAVWIGLTKEHYGIHGTPEPGSIRHGESAGCIRMTNWDAVDLSHMVRHGTPVILEE